MSFMRRLVLWGFCLLTLFVSVWADEVAPASAPVGDPQWRGRYKLFLSNDAAWHNNALDLDSFTLEDIEGTLEVDLSPGPDSRDPGVDEILHKLHLKGHRTSDTDPYIAEVLVGSVQPRVYRFELYPLEVGKSMVGVVTMGSKRAGVLLRRD